MPSELTIGIATPSFNHERFVLQSVRSILTQERRDLELLVVDDGSTDNSMQVLGQVRDPRCRIIAQEHAGLARVLERGFRETSGDIMGWVNSDDMLLPGALAAVNAYFSEHHECRFLYGDAVVIDSKGRLIKAKKEIEFDRNILLWDYCYIPQPSAFWRRSLYEEVGGVDTSFNHCMDYDMWLRFADVARPHHLRSFLSAIRDHAASQTRTRQDVRKREDLRIKERICGRKVGPLERVRKKLWHKARRIRKRLAIGAYRARPATPDR